MARIQIPEPGKLIVSIIYSSMDALADAVTALEKKFGRVDMETMEIETVEAGFYREEMGERLQRRFISFERPIKRDSLPEIKATCGRIEPRFSDRVGDHLFRAANLDPGILSPENLVMSSYRELNHRFYLGEGVFGELTLIYSRGQFTRLPWTSLDFCHDEAIDLFERVRNGFVLVEPEEAVHQ